jgi:hypothetical protein
MKINLDKDTMTDELYNMLLLHFVQEAVVQGVDVLGSTQFDNWTISCEVNNPIH